MFHREQIDAGIVKVILIEATGIPCSQSQYTQVFYIRVQGIPG